MSDDGYGAGYDCEWYDAVPAPVIPYLVPIPVPEPAPMEPVAPAKRTWMERHRRWVLLVGGGILFPGLLMAVGTGLAWVLRHERLWEQGWNLGRSPWILLLAVPVALGSVAGLHVLTKLVPAMERALKETGATDHRETIRLLGYPGMVLLVVTSGLGEEVLFRGGLQPTITIPAAALLFGLAHGGWQRRMWAYVVAATLAGCFYGLVYYCTGVLWVAMLAHGLHNIMSVLFAGKKIAFEWDGGLPRLRVTEEEP